MGYEKYWEGKQTSKENETVGIVNKWENLKYTCNTLLLCKSCIIKISSKSQEEVTQIIMMLRPKNDTEIAAVTGQYQHKQ